MSSRVVTFTVKWPQVGMERLLVGDSRAARRRPFTMTGLAGEASGSVLPLWSGPAITSRVGSSVAVPSRR